MFERRLKIFFAVLLVFIFALLARAVQLQVVQHQYWSDLATKSMRVRTLADTSRGRILDCKGAVLAEDEPCIDAAIDYRILTDPPEEAFIFKLAMKRAKDRPGGEYLKSNAIKRVELVKQEKALLLSQIQGMWEKLARLSSLSRDEIDARRKAIQDRVEMRRRVVWYERYQSLQKATGVEDPSWYRKWISGEQSDPSQIDDFPAEPLKEEFSPHVILEAIDTTVQNELEKHADDYPGLTLETLSHRIYPYGPIACHVIGHMGRIWKEDVTSDTNAHDDLRAYQPDDLKGRDGLEALGEPTLRGTRGVTERDSVSNAILFDQPPQPGGDLHTTLDIDLQQEIQRMFAHVRVPYGPAKQPQWDTLAMHGAAVVIDVKTGEVKAMASAPDYDLNDFDAQYATLSRDNLDAPLMNRATQALREPGSTVKPVVGSGAITQGLLGVNEGIECTGYLTLRGQKYAQGKCWTVATAKTAGIEPAHHPFPVPHHGHDGNADGFLTFSDALERSCNVFFETTADRLHAQGLSFWMKQYGLGRPTGIGIPEVRGVLPDEYTGPNSNFATWTAGIGQQSVLVTPLQMANVAATIARRGIWMRPTLVQAGQSLSPWRPRKAELNDPVWDNIPSQIDLHLSPPAVEAMFDGMKRVVNGEAGTGTFCARKDMTVAGKTGTVQAARFLAPTTDPSGQITMTPLPPSTHDQPNNDHPWYRASDDKGEKLNHAWVIAFFPEERPQFAISVMIEYAGAGGGAVAGPVARQIIDALVEHGYLHPRTTTALNLY